MEHGEPSLTGTGAHVITAGRPGPLPNVILMHRRSLALESLKRSNTLCLRLHVNDKGRPNGTDKRGGECW